MTQLLAPCAGSRRDVDQNRTLALGNSTGHKGRVEGGVGRIVSGPTIDSSAVEVHVVRGWRSPIMLFRTVAVPRLAAT